MKSYLNINTLITILTLITSLVTVFKLVIANICLKIREE